MNQVCSYGAYVIPSRQAPCAFCCPKKVEESSTGAQDFLELAHTFGLTADYLLFEAAPRDGRVDIPDAELLKLFEELSTIDEKTRCVAKELLDSLLFKKRVAQKFEKRVGGKE